MNSLISVIVPVYKAEETLTRCVRSICTQTYGNLEIILVEDGSPDGCAALCDRLAAEDPRILVIHQENRGVAAARNAGLARAHGDYLGFVDSDDWIEPEMYEKLLGGIIREQAQICLCGVRRTYHDEVVDVKKTDRPVVRSGEEAICDLMKNRAHSLVVWNKLWKRELFDGMLFPEGRVFEDAAITWKMIMKAERVLFLPDCLYHYVQVQGSLVHTYSMKSFQDEWVETKERFDILASRYPSIYDKLLGECAMVIARVWGWYRKADTRDKEAYQDLLNEMNAFVRQHADQIRKGRIPFYIKTGCLFAYHVKPWSFVMAGAFHTAFRKLKGNRKNRLV